MNKVLRNEIYKIALCSLFTVLTFTAGRLSFYIPVAGFPAFKFSLTAIPIVIGSFLLGPIYGGIIGGLGDLIGALLFPVGAYFFGFTFDAILLGVIPGLVMYLSKKSKYFSPIILSVLFILTFSLLAYFFVSYNTITISKKEIYLSIPLKVIVICIYLALFGIGFFAIWYNYRKNKNIVFLNAFVSLFANELIVSGLIASLWKTMLYSLPYFLNVGIALLYMLINIPLKTIAVSFIYPTVVEITSINRKSLALSKISDKGLKN